MVFVVRNISQLGESMYQYTFYTFSNRDYFESLNNYVIKPAYLEALRSLLPETWNISRSEIWLEAQPPRPILRPQGFKIHLTVTVPEGLQVLERFIPVCVQANVTFKIAADPTLHQFLNSKRYSRSGSGKFATIYPHDEECFLELLEALAQVTREFAGPYVLSDRRYKDSKVVFYRYGAFKRMQELKADGTRAMLIKNPQDAYVPDERVPYFSIPEWVTDPVAVQKPEPMETEEGLLHERYSVQEALSFTNTGGVYRAIDQATGQTVVIKESRPKTVLWATQDFTVDSNLALRSEHMCLACLQGLPFIPTLIDFFDEWEHAFLVTSFCEGLPLANLRAQEEFILLTRIGMPEQTKRFCRTWQSLCLQLLDAIAEIHERGIILGDISPSNILMNRETGKITFIDFESAQLPTNANSPLGFGTHWFYPGFRKPERRSSTSLVPSDDYYSCGMVMYNLLCPIQTLFELDKTHPVDRILDYFVAEGVPRQIQSVIHALLQGSPEEARRLLSSWDVDDYESNRQTCATSTMLETSGVTRNITDQTGTGVRTPV
jgi:protein kinase-like protein